MSSVCLTDRPLMRVLREMIESTGWRGGAGSRKSRGDRQAKRCLCQKPRRPIEGSLMQPCGIGDAVLQPLNRQSRASANLRSV